MILEFLVLCVCIALMLLYLWFQRTEPFEEQIHLVSCPTGYQSVHQADGNTICCNGEIVSNRCIGGTPCTLNGKETADYPLCVAQIQTHYQEQGAQCPSSLPTYFEDQGKKRKGCTKGGLNATLTGPKTPAQPVCTIYASEAENQHQLDSCSNQREMEDFPCFGQNCTKQLTQPQPDTPVLIAVSFTDSSGMHRVAHTRASMERSLDATQPNWRSSGMDLSKNIGVAEVARAVYVDKTMDLHDAQM